MTFRFRICLALLLLPALSADSALAASPQESKAAVAGLKKYLAGKHDSRPPLAQQPFATVPLTKTDAQVAAKLLWKDRADEIRKSRAAEMQDRVLRDGNLAMPFFYETFGQKPKGGRSLFISMHGGGGCPKEVNDQQWENQKHLYRPAEGVYLAPRAPTNNWNLWHEAHIDRMFARLIEDMIVFEDVNPDRVYIMGYSAGGDGVYQLAPRMADSLAAAAMMAGHPNDASPLGLRNLPFTIHVGALDSGFDRNKIAAQWETKLDDLQKADPQGYIHLVKLHAGKAHWMDREDAEAVPWLAQYTRDAAPKKVVWKQAGATHARYYWLAVNQEDEKPGNEITAEITGQRIDLSAQGVKHLRIRLNDKMLNLDKPVTITSKSNRLLEATPQRTIAVLAATLDERADPAAGFCAEIAVDCEQSP